MTTEEAARRWTDVWARGWREHDVDAIAALYADDALFRSAPFRDRHLGRDGLRAYVAWAFGDEEPGAEVRFGQPFVAGDRAVVEYWAVVTTAGREETIAGVALIRFRADGLVAEQRDYWHMEPARREPPADFGR